MHKKAEVAVRFTTVSLGTGVRHPRSCWSRQKKSGPRKPSAGIEHDALIFEYASNKPSPLLCSRLPSERPVIDIYHQTGESVEEKEKQERTGRIGNLPVCGKPLMKHSSWGKSFSEVFTISVESINSRILDSIILFSTLLWTFDLPRNTNQ